MSTERIVNYRDLDAWRVSMDLAETAYSLARSLPPSERFELSSQIREAAVSIPANVAEGHATRMPKRCANHVRTSLGSLAELYTELELSRRLGYLSDQQLQPVLPQIDRVGQLLHGLLRSKEAQALRATVLLLAFVGACVAIATVLR